MSLFAKKLRNRPPAPLLGATLADKEDNKYGRRRSASVLAVRHKKRIKRLLRASLVIGVSAILLVLLFFYTHEVQVEIRKYSRGWIKKTFLPIDPMTSTCFDANSISSSHYNTTLAYSPIFVDFHAGIAMPHGDDCYNFASTLPRHPTPAMLSSTLPAHTIFHTYWRTDLLPLVSRQISLLHSILAAQDPASTSLILWINHPSPATFIANNPRLNPLLQLYGSRLSVQSIDKKELARGTPMEGHQFLEMADKKAWVDGDVVRILVLWAKGGMWIDMDMIMTGRDLRVLTESEWVIQWDCYDKIYRPLNGAMMHFYRNSPFMCEMLHQMATGPEPASDSIDWGSLLYHKVWRRLLANGIKPFKILPFCFTDAFSCRLDNRLPNPFGNGGSGTERWDRLWGKGRVENLKRKVDSMWGVHLHNQWDKKFPKGGWIRELIITKIDEKVRVYRATKGVEAQAHQYESEEQEREEQMREDNEGL